MKRYFYLIFVNICVTVLLFGCSSETITTNEINPIDSIVMLKVSVSNTFQKEYTDKIAINKIVEHLSKIQVQKLTPSQETNVIDREKMMQDTTYIIELFETSGANAKSIFIMPSDKELMLTDVKTMQGIKRSVSYLNINDKTSIDNVKAIYLIIQQLTKDRTGNNRG